jgi:hypothetical protein
LLKDGLTVALTVWLEVWLWIVEVVEALVAVAFGGWAGGAVRRSLAVALCPEGALSEKPSCLPALTT